MAPKNTIFLVGHTVPPPKARQFHLACSGSQSWHRFWFTLPSGIISHIIIKTLKPYLNRQLVLIMMSQIYTSIVTAGDLNNLDAVTHLFTIFVKLESWHSWNTLVFSSFLSKNIKDSCNIILAPKQSLILPWQHYMQPLNE